jgi:hypothetical protein
MTEIHTLLPLVGILRRATKHASIKTLCAHQMELDLCPGWVAEHAINLQAAILSFVDRPRQLETLLARPHSWTICRGLTRSCIIRVRWTTAACDAPHDNSGVLAVMKLCSDKSTQCQIVICYLICRSQIEGVRGISFCQVSSAMPCMLSGWPVRSVSLMALTLRSLAVFTEAAYQSQDGLRGELDVLHAFLACVSAGSLG